MQPPKNSAECRSELAFWVDSLARWELKFDGTFARPKSALKAASCYERFMREVLPGVSYFVAVEANPSSPGHHIHATWAGCGSLRRKVIWKRWFGLYGRNLIEPIRGKRDALDYVCKSLSYAAKEPIWWDVKLCNSDLWHRASHGGVSTD